MRYFLDTNIFLRFLIVEDRKTHEACKRLFFLIREKKIRAVTSSVVFAEIVWVLASFYQFPKEKVIEAVKVFQVTGIPLCDHTDIQCAIHLYDTLNVKFVDALLASSPLLQKKSMYMISYDTDFDKTGVVRLTPKEIIKNKKFLR